MKSNINIWLLVIFGIFITVAVFWLWSYPYFSNWGKRPHWQTGCMSDLKQIGLGLEMYSNDYDGFYPEKSGAAGLEQLRSLDYITDYRIFACRRSKYRNNHGKNNQPLTEQSVSYYYRGGMSKQDAADSAVCWSKPDSHMNFGSILYIDGFVKGVSGANWMEEIK